MDSRSGIYYKYTPFPSSTDFSYLDAIFSLDFTGSPNDLKKVNLVLAFTAASAVYPQATAINIFRYNFNKVSV